MNTSPARPPAAAATAAAVTERPDRGSTAGPPPREFFVDWLRIIALALLILYHVGMAYVAWPWHVKSAAAGAEVAAALQPWMNLSGPWRMTLLFVISGLATALMLERRGAGRSWGTSGDTGGSASGCASARASASAGTSAGASAEAPGWLRERARRLLLPLLAGVVLVVPPQSYFEVRQFHGYAGSYLDFLALYFSAHSGFCAPQRACLILPTWNHLWFLPYLFVYTALLALALRRWPQALDQAAARLPHWLSGTRLLWLPLAWFVATRLVLRPLFGETHALVDDGFLHAQYAPAFALGVVLARGGLASALWPRLEAARHWALALVLLAWALLTSTAPGLPWRAVPWSVMQWCAIVAALGYARCHLQRDNAARRVLSEAVFPVYVLHQTVIVLAVVALAPWALGAAAEAALVVALTFGVSAAGYMVARRSAWLRPWFGLAPKRHAQGAANRAMDPRVST